MPYLFLSFLSKVVLAQLKPATEVVKGKNYNRNSDSTGGYHSMNGRYEIFFFIECSH